MLGNNLNKDEGSQGLLPATLLVPLLQIEMNALIVERVFKCYIASDFNLMFIRVFKL